ncbi:MAG: NAD(P)-dependent oxidoreductase, partial [Lysobacterales bacterium]
MNQRLLPLFLDLRGRRVLVVGAGSVAARKIAALIDTGAGIVVGARRVGAEVQALADAGSLQLRLGDFEDAWLEDAWLVVAATNDPKTNARIVAAAAARRLFVNAVDDRAASSAQFPAVVQRGLLQIAISTAGAAPMLGRAARERIEALFDESWAGLARWFERHRDRIRAAWPAPAARRQWFEACLRGATPGLLRAGHEAEADRLLDAAMTEPATSTGAPGSVVLVGAGPGDPGLMTLRGLRELNCADVIVHDQLVSAEVLALARRDARRIDVGKRAGQHGSTQADINALLIALAQGGERVLRLKGGDPFVF